MASALGQIPSPDPISQAVNFVVKFAVGITRGIIQSRSIKGSAKRQMRLAGQLHTMELQHRTEQMEKSTLLASSLAPVVVGGVILLGITGALVGGKRR